MTAEYNKVAIISTIVEDSEVEKISKAIVDAVFTGEEGDGIISISNIENVLNIASKKRDLEAL
jgi:nitrogen regulatory protein P-II 1